MVVCQLQDSQRRREQAEQQLSALHNCPVLELLECKVRIQKQSFEPEKEFNALRELMRAAKSSSPRQPADSSSCDPITLIEQAIGKTAGDHTLTAIDRALNELIMVAEERGRNREADAANTQRQKDIRDAADEQRTAAARINQLERQLNGALAQHKADAEAKSRQKDQIDNLTVQVYMEQGNKGKPEQDKQRLAQRERYEGVVDQMLAEQPISGPTAAEERYAELVAVHGAMDGDGSGFIEAAELMLLGQARRKLGQQQGAWNADMNTRLMAKIDTNGDGKVGPSEFAAFFDKTLPADPSDFTNTIKQFMDVAAQCRVSPPAAARGGASGDGCSRSAALWELFEQLNCAANGELKTGALNAMLDTWCPVAKKAGIWKQVKQGKLLCSHRLRTDAECGENFVKEFKAALSELQTTDFDWSIAQLKQAAERGTPKSSGKTASKSAARNQSAGSESQSPKARGEPKKNPRVEKLTDLFYQFDLDNSGFVEPQELLQLGKARRSAGQKVGDWTEEENSRLVKKMDAKGDGKIRKAEFVEYFEFALPRSSSNFDAIMVQFQDAARACRTAAPAKTKSRHSSESAAKSSKSSMLEDKLNQMLSTYQN